MGERLREDRDQRQQKKYPDESHRHQDQRDLDHRMVVGRRRDISRAGAGSCTHRRDWTHAWKMLRSRMIVKEMANMTTPIAAAPA
jgi:hypothetical protein